MSVRPKLTSPGQFGLWGRETKRDWPLITQDEASLVLAAFDLPDITPIEWHSARPFSAVSRLSDCDGKNWFLKRHHRFLRDESALAEEHDLIAHLAGQGLSVACPLEASSGKTSLSLGEWCYECFPALGGNDLYRDRLSWEPYLTRHHAQEAGYALACLHEKAQSWNAPSRSTRPLVSSVIPLLDRHGPETGLKDG
ncbi:phosphotransferase enzyme family protein [Asaia prunellae]|uniref:phosphotransferase enzyme family protein n=1 Tax=Asaia prunellae TaxID=610245 RepID=UPI000686210F|nr:phosphotransferase [Asaia prunellae]